MKGLRSFWIKIKNYWRKAGAVVNFQNRGDPTSEPTRSLSYADVRVARALLQTLKLPTELVLDILERAEYTPCLQFTILSKKNPAKTKMHPYRFHWIWRENLTRRIGGPKTLKFKEVRFDIVSRLRNEESSSMHVHFSVKMHIHIQTW